MLYLNIASNVNILSDLVEDGDIETIVRNAYNPLLRFYEEDGIKSSLFFAGRTLEALEERFPSVLEGFQRVVERGTVEVGAHTYGHPVSSLITVDEFRKHMEYSQELEERIFGRTAKGFLPPEWVYDVTLPEVLQSFGIEWTILLGAQIVGYYGQQQKDTFKVGLLQGTHNVRIPSVFVYDDPDLWFRNNLFNVFIGVKDPREFAEESYEKIAPFIEGEQDSLVVFYFDLETPAFNYRDDVENDPCKNFRKFIDRFISLSDGVPTSLSDYVGGQNLDNCRTIHPVLTRTYKDFDIWWNGSQKLDLETSLAREMVWKAKRDPRIHRMWKEYLLSQSSDARAAASDQRAKGLNISGKNIFFGKRERVIEAYEHVRKAKELAQEILIDHENSTKKSGNSN